MNRKLRICGVIRFNKKFDFRYETAQTLRPGLRRIVARNPKDFTFTGTNTYLLGDDELAIIDPGPELDEHIAALLDAIGPRPLVAILVTHSHLDHSPAAAALQAETGAPIYGHSRVDEKIARRTEEDVDLAFRPDVVFRDGKTLDFGRERLEAIHTPGHFPNHLCFRWAGENVIFSGDHVMGWSTTVISPPLGHLGQYLHSLEKLQKIQADLYFPSHGPAIEEPTRYVSELIAHRKQRDRQIRHCLAKGRCDPADIVDEIYDALTPRLVTAARQSVRAHLHHMEETGVLVDGRLVSSRDTRAKSVVAQ